jgi:hypothetical protein
VRTSPKALDDRHNAEGRPGTAVPGAPVSDGVVLRVEVAVRRLAAMAVWMTLVAGLFVLDAHDVSAQGFPCSSCTGGTSGDGTQCGTGCWYCQPENPDFCPEGDIHYSTCGEQGPCDPCAPFQLIQREEIGRHKSGYCPAFCSLYVSYQDTLENACGGQRTNCHDDLDGGCSGVSNESCCNYYGCWGQQC